MPHLPISDISGTTLPMFGVSGTTFLMFNIPDTSNTWKVVAGSTLRETLAISKLAKNLVSFLITNTNVKAVVLID